MVSAKNMKDDKLKGLLLGADDYIEKPYDIDILIAKVKGVFSRRYSTDAFSDSFLRIDKLKKTVKVLNGKAEAAKKETELTQKEYELLSLLVENTGKTMNKDFLFNKIWGIDSDSEQQTLTVHIKWLRQKIEEDPKNPKHIVTVWGVGYRYE